MGGVARTLREAVAPGCSATREVQQLSLFNNSLFSATLSVQQLSVLSNSVCSATPSIQQLYQFSNSFCSAFPLFSNSFNLATLSVHHAITSPPYASRPSCFCASRRAPSRRQAGPVPGGDEGFRAHSAILRAAR